MKRILKGIWFVVFVLCALFVMVLMYSLSSEDGFTSSNRSNIVTESLKEEVKETLRSSPKGYSLAKRIKGYIIGRTMSKKDVLIDFSGSSLSVLILSLFKK